MEMEKTNGLSEGTYPMHLVFVDSSKQPHLKHVEVDIIQKIIGSMGKYQYWICFLIYINKFPVAFHQMVIIFLAPPVHYTCPDTNMQTCPCSEPVYNTSTFSNTIIMEWDLICDRTWLRDLTQTLFQLGTLFGSVFFGMASDRFGRRYPLIAAVVLQVSAGVGAAYIQNYWGFTFLRLLVGASVGGTMVVGFVVVMEFVGSEYRDLASAAYQIPFNLGHLLLPVFGYYFRDYFEMQLAVSLPSVVLLAYFFLMPESPRWLLAVRDTEKAVKILEQVAKVNDRPVDNIKPDAEAYQVQREQNEHRKGTILDLIRTPNLRRNTICMSFNWLVCSYCFYGVSQYVGQLSGNIFLNVAVSACLALTGTIVSIPLMKKMGRRTLIIGAHLTCAACLLLIGITPDGIASVVLASIGVMTSFIVFVVVYLFCSELFPTVVRNNAVGISSMMARVGSMVAPFVVGLKDMGRWCPPVAFGVMPILAAVFCWMLPETKGCELMTTIEEGETFGTKRKTVSMQSEFVNKHNK